jgi:hypothetical protein
MRGALLLPTHALLIEICFSASARELRGGIAEAAGQRANEERNHCAPAEELTRIARVLVNAGDGVEFR